MSDETEVIGKRATKVKVMGTLLFMVIVCFLFGIPGTILLLIYLSPYVIVAAALVVFGSFMLVFMFAPIKNNKNPNPVIVLRPDGVFVIYHPNGKEEALLDKIIEVTARPFGKNEAGENYGHITFKLEKPATGQSYLKFASFVLDCEETTARIKEILAAKTNTISFSK